MKKPVQAKPRYLKTKPSYLIRLPFVVTSGEETSPHEYNNGAHAAIHSILAGLQCDTIGDVNFWLRQGRRQLSSAIRALVKPGAAIVCNAEPQRRRGVKA